MELTHQTLLEELIMSPKIDTSYNWIQFPNELFPNSWTFTPFDHQIPNQQHLHFPTVANPSLLQLISPAEFGHPCPFLDALTLPEMSSFYDIDDVAAMPPAVQEEYVETNGEVGFLDNGFFKVDETGQVVDALVNMEEMGNVGGERKGRGKKPNGQPSKNLMAERRRRKRLNDRLSMLRSIVPKISKMDRTSILGDTIDYMRELLDKIHRLQEEGMSEPQDLNHIINLTPNSSNHLKPNQVIVRNPPKFDVERRNEDTRVEVCCTAKPGLLISTLSTLDALGLDIHQCVISCFNDFSLQASCYEVGEHRSLVSSEDVKQALFSNAGYGGRCL
ncbi:Transcription factor [Sesamum alatum]|uniref:Transcription factor n=1 Tax=Sesamum alatum TaxID=300844 RepID=A0AAE2CLF6_9LAMI|nr:Transcription factor [Sesamum alatum]